MAYKDKEKQREYQRRWLANRRAEFFADKACIWCGSTEDLELDHIDPSKKVSHKIWSWSAARREAEIAKCRILCYSCHKVRTVEQLSTAKHGSTTLYDKGCRCDLCKLAKSHKNALRYMPV